MITILPCCRLLADTVEKGLDSIVVSLDAAFDGRRHGCAVALR
jgi:hypothetical protein